VCAAYRPVAWVIAFAAWSHNWGASGLAVAAFSAHADEGTDYVVADFVIGYAFADSDYPAGSFVAEYDRRWERDGAVGGGEVAVA
jgi:hypothetical protein